jgi:hypothetical protein
VKLLTFSAKGSGMAASNTLKAGISMMRMVLPGRIQR